MLLCYVYIYVGDGKLLLRNKDGNIMNILMDTLYMYVYPSTRVVGGKYIRYYTLHLSTIWLVSMDNKIIRKGFAETPQLQIQR